VDLSEVAIRKIIDSLISVLTKVHGIMISNPLIIRKHMLTKVHAFLTSLHAAPVENGIGASPKSTYGNSDSGLAHPGPDLAILPRPNFRGGPRQVLGSALAPSDCQPITLQRPRRDA
jgi:hypothetical protein